MQVYVEAALIEGRKRVMERSSTLIGRLTGLATMIIGLLWAVGGSTALNYDGLGITLKLRK